MDLPIISNNQIKHFRSLHQHKFRKELQQYLVEGVKNVEEWLEEDADVECVIAIKEWYATHLHLLGNIPKEKCLVIIEKDLEKLSGFKTPNQVVLVVNMPKQQSVKIFDDAKWIIMLDTIQDPGNLGTIIRTADWFGIQDIICSKGTAEQFNPKVIQSTMGSLLRVQCHYENLPDFLEKHSEIPIYAALLDGTPLNGLENFKPGIILMGNESNGISDEVKKLVHHRLLIPRLGKAESLNVAVATGIFCNALINR
ncbi:MAG TPA: RNA methyltransferase [Edaphocola sp.]|nr:RNA methyltransferase [Edaphocola sp.]